MKPFLVVDASVAVKWFKPEGEQLLAEAVDLLVRHRNESVALAAPSHLRLEVLNALWSNRLDAERLTLVARDLQDFELAWFEPDTELVTEAARLAVHLRLTLYDAVYVALARYLDVPLVTCDSAILECAPCRLHTLG